MQFHELPIPDHMAQTADGPSAMHNGPKMNLAFAPSKQLSALETLAEVSRQHLDLTGQRMPEKQPLQGHNHNHNHNVNHAGLLDEFLIDDRTDSGDIGSMSQSMDMSNAPAMPAMYQFNGPLHHSPNASPHMSSMQLSNTGSAAPSLVMAASAANDLMPLTDGMTMESDMTLTSNGMSDKFFHAQGRAQWPPLQPNSFEPLMQDHNKEDQMNRTMAHPRPIAMNPSTHTHFTTDFSVNHKITKPKVRGRFSDTRRKEVQEVRKRGACIRCRMLKKPCSGENPCNTCQNVESARLWKQPCIRTRIAEEFSLYSAGLHAMLAHHAVYQAKGSIRLNQTPGRIEASHHPSSGHFATFTPLKCQQTQPADIDPLIFASLASPDLELIDTDDDISGKLDAYIKKIGPTLHSAEPSPFMQTTIQTALSIIPTSTSTDQLLPKVLELWSFNRILTCTSLTWHLYSNPTEAPSHSGPNTDNPSRTPITHAPSLNLIKLQLHSATEKRAACLARTIMNDLERRLLQRQQANPFETFLVAVILLACVERMCWLFRTYEPTSSSETDLAKALQSQSKWPLDKAPAQYAQQGERFSDILNMLLKMRGVPPKPTPRDGDGVLLMVGDEVDESVGKWYEGIGVSVEMLDERRDGDRAFVGVESGEWEFRFVGKILRGD